MSAGSKTLVTVDASEQTRIARESFMRYRRGGAAGTNQGFIGILKQMITNNVKNETIAAYVDRVVILRVNSEREELIRIALELDISPGEPPIAAAGAKWGPTGAAEASISLCRRRFAKNVRERIQDVGEDE